MRERQELDDRHRARSKRIERELEEQYRADRARRGRGRQASSPRPKRRSRRCARGRAPPGRDAAVGRGRRQRHLSRDPCRRRRHREPGLGRDAAAHVCALGGARTATRSRVLEEHAGEEAGIKSATIQSRATTPMAGSRPNRACTGWCASRPIDSNARRHTSFASVWVYPVVDDKIEIDVNEGDCRIDTYRSPGAGGQHVNTTEFGGAHHPSADRHRRRLPERALAAQEPGHRLEHAARAALRGGAAEARGGGRAPPRPSKTDIGWGHQIRSYVLQPYQLVKDLRTGVESTSPPTCSTATSTTSWKPRCRNASRAVPAKPSLILD